MKLVSRYGFFSLAILLGLSMFQVPRVGATDNIDYVSTYDPRPVFSELLDCEYRHDTLFVAGVSGFTVVDVADKESPRLIGRYTPPGHPYERYYHIAVAESVAYGFARDDGIAVIDFSRPTQPSRIDNFNPDGFAFEDGQVHQGKLFATAHSEGLFIFEIEADGRINLLKQFKEETENATALVLVDSLAYIADGNGGVSVLNVKDPSSPTFVSRISTTSAAQDIGFYGNYAAVAVGAEGVDLIDFANPASPQFVSNYQGLGSAFNLSVEDSLVYLARWEGVEVVNIARPLNPTLVGWEDTPNRAMGLTVNSSFIYVADWSRVEIYLFGGSQQPDIYIDFSLLDLGDGEPGEVIDTFFTVYNTGGQPLTVTDITWLHPDFNIFPLSALIPSDSSFDFQIRYEVNDTSYQTDFILVWSEDPDEPTTLFRAIANGNFRLHVGDPAPDFTLPGIDGETYTLSDYYGTVVLLAFFASW